jgi:transketolase
MVSDQILKSKSADYRKTILRIIKQARAGHTGGDLSAIDILNVLYNHVMNVSPENFTNPNRDRFVQSKGHCVEALYTVLADRGFFPEADLDTLCRYQSPYIGHPTRGVPGIEHNTGSLGHGLAVAVGMALAGKLDSRDYRVFTLMGDGELGEGSVWEAAMAASHYHLDNLIAIIDRNGLQITGLTETVNPLEPLADKFRAFGFALREVDGNDTAALVELFEQMPFEPGKPNAIIAHTVKGKGVSFIENVNKWHHRAPSDEEYKNAVQELDLAYEQDEGR